MKKKKNSKNKKTSITLSPYHQKIIEREMKTGKFSSISRLLSYGLLLVEKESLLLDKAKKKLEKKKK